MSATLLKVGVRPGAASGAPFAPGDVAGLVLWMDSTQGTFVERTSPTTATTEGNPVGTWVARTGGVTVTAPSDAARPTLSSNLVSFDDINDTLTSAVAFWPSGDITVIVRMLSISGLTVGTFFGPRATYGDQRNWFYSNGANRIWRFSTGPFLSYSDNTMFSYSCTATGTAPTSTERARINGGAWSTVSNTRPAVAGTQDLCIGSNGDGGQFSDCRIRHLLVYNTVVSDANIALLETFVAA